MAQAIAERSAYPVTVRGVLDPATGRWLWLFKWLLAIPHYVVLFLLWIAVAVVWVIALVAILVTGRYPRALFDFTVGVLRWSWRVGFYSYAALGTDRYPPFSLEPDPSYPADLDVAYPERLSRGLVLVKWWLLAIPHYLILGILTSGAVGLVRDGRDRDTLGLLTVLVCVFAVVLLFAGRRLQGVFDLMLGIDRWSLRVAGYTLLLTDAYPPMRLDQGGEEPPSAGAVVAPAAPPARSGSGWGPWQTGGVVLGSLGIVLGLGLGFLGVGARVADSRLRDDAGFLSTPDGEWKSSAYAVTSPDVDLAHAPGWLPDRLVGDVRLRVRSLADDVPVFVGIAPTSQVQSYLLDVGHSVVTDPGNADLDVDPSYQQVPGGAPRVLPDELSFWTVRASGTDRLDVRWHAEKGEWTAVVMNVDGSSGVRVEGSVGITVPVLGAGAATLLVLSGIALAVGIAFVVWAVVSAARSWGDDDGPSGVDA